MAPARVEDLINDSFFSFQEQFYDPRLARTDFGDAEKGGALK
jgi:hypothetical protein